MESIVPKELARRLAQGERLFLLDVREPDEWEIARIAGSVLIPLGELAARVDELDSSLPTVCICHHGVRSARAGAHLARAGFTHVLNLTGGVERWALEVDPSMARY